MLLALAAAAAAAYTPTVAIELSTHAPGEAPAVTSTMTLRSDQSATRTVAARFPPDFTYNPDFEVPGCAPPDEEAGTCPAASRIGTIAAASPLGSAEGPVHVTEDLRLVGYLRAYAGLAEVRVHGVIRALDDGSAEVVFDGLPDLPSTYGRISLEGGEKGMLVNPLECGEHAVRVRFTSHAEETAEQTVPLAITGCPPDLELRRPRLTGRRLTWRVSEPAVTHVTLLRRAGAVWRELRRWSTRRERLRVGRLRTGEYRLTLRARTPDGRATIARSLRVTRP